VERSAGYISDLPLKIDEKAGPIKLLKLLIPSWSESVENWF
jgi:hypothetical protein